MKFEILKKSHLKRNIIIGVGVILIISAIILNFTRAKYRTSQSIPLVNGTINYTPYDFKMVAMYQENNNGEYVEIETMPSSGYVINESKSYCTIDNANKDEDVFLYTNNAGEHVISNLKKNSKCYLYFDEVGPLSAEQAILTYAKRGSGTPNFTNTSCSNGSNNGGNCEEATIGLYEGTENDETIYYFRGDVDDNWVSFAGFYWRIIRTNSDDSIRMIYNGTNTATTGSGTQISLNGSTTTYAFNSSYNASYYVGLKYSNSQHGTTTNSSIMTTLNTWFSNNLTSYASYLTSGTGFCNDREMANDSSWSATPSSDIFYAGYERLVSNKIPTLDCSNNNDKFTTSGTGTGNGTLSNPIGLITADEVAMAGAVYRTTNYGYYLYTNSIYWTMSPSYFNSYNSRANVFRVYSSGSLNNDNSLYNMGGIRPVINLKADVILTGSGTTSDPYEVVGT